MKIVPAFVAACLATLALARAARAQDEGDRMAWWREARFGMFIHWGLYAIPAGEWGADTHHGEWIRTTAQIPVERYDEFRAQFNPVDFDADAWVSAARAAGMRYIVITSKHHDGFGLFDSLATDHDVMDTPFKRDILAELAEACREQDMRLCFYYSIMDWHHPDYLPRRDWEKDRPSEGASFPRYVEFMKAQLRELLTNYGDIGILWFDGQWEGTWNNELGKDLETFVRGLQPNIIINNRVGRGGGPYGTEPGRLGDYATPEQFVPDSGPGVDWETCMTMNGHWGFNQADLNYKSRTELIRMLADIASKDGNFLLNVGPTARGTFPRESLDRLGEIGQWMESNQEAVRGTRGTPFGPLPWGRITQRRHDDGVTRLYLHVFEWPASGRITVPGLLNSLKGATILATGAPVRASRSGADVWVMLPRQPIDAADSVIALDVVDEPDIATPPTIDAPARTFVDTLDVVLASSQDSVQLRYTTDGTNPVATSPVASGPIRLSASTEIRAAAFRATKVVSPVASASFARVEPRASATPQSALAPGLDFTAFEGDWNTLPDFASMTPAASGHVNSPSLTVGTRDEHFGIRFTGFIDVPEDAVYVLTIESDDGSRMRVGDAVIDNDGLHSLAAKSGEVALARGLHPVVIDFFEKSGGDELNLYWQRAGQTRERIPAAAWKRSAK